MKLVIVHYHLRPGGVRRVIELAAPHLVRQFRGRVDSIVMATGEKPDVRWETLFRAQLKEIPVEFLIEPSFGYLSEQALTMAQVGKRIRAALEVLLKDVSADNAVIWAHNLGIGRNLRLTAELTRACGNRKVPLAMHHHDWWFDNRWLRWPEMRRAGFRTLDQVARVIFPAVPCAHYLTINRADAAPLRRHFPRKTHWLPNLIERSAPPANARVRRAQIWLGDLIGNRRAPVWIFPSRCLRRKNMAEALLLTRWLRPEAWLVTTGGPSSASEQSYFDRFTAVAREHGWPLQAGVLRGDETNKPSVGELLVASEAVLLTSIQEGFGLPFLEAAAARRPLIARSIPNIAPDLARLGFQFPQYYKEILVAPELFDLNAEKLRQAGLFQSWRKVLPAAVRKYVGQPELLAAMSSSKPVTFSRLTLTAQLEVLRQPVDYSWALCARLNPFLAQWRKRAQSGRLELTAWPSAADEWLSGPAYARHFVEAIARLPKSRPRPGAAASVQTEFLRIKLHAQQMFPLLWSTCT